MNGEIPSVHDECSTFCSTSPMETLNRECFCIAVDQQALHSELARVLGTQGLPKGLLDSHPHLFSALPVYITRQHIRQIASVVAAIHEVTALPGYQHAVLSWAPEIARFDPGSPGGLLGLDFHLETDGPRLIEINTNPGGALLNVVLGRALRACMPDLTMPPADPARMEDAVLATLLTEWSMQRGDLPLAFIAIVDEAPTQQYLYPEFVLIQELLRRHGYHAGICSPEQLCRRAGRLWWGEQVVDLVYNRLTDFTLQQPVHEVLRDAYLSGEVVLTPHPRAHALYADKRNLSVLGESGRLHAWGASQGSIAVLTAAVPLTELMTSENRAEMWARRRELFFKPAAGFGSKASYRGDKVTRRVWDEIDKGVYVAQQFVVPSERQVNAGSHPLKVDIRCYAYRGDVLLYAARMYQGQTTNFRTPGGGFAPVLTSRSDHETVG